MGKKKPNTNFRLGLNRQELVQAAQRLGKSEKSAKKANTKSLEQYLTSQLGGRGTKVPLFSEMQKRDIRDSTKSYGLLEGLHMVSSRIRKVTGSHNEDNFLRLTVGAAISAYTDEQVTTEDISEVISRLGTGEKSEIISGTTKHDFYYQSIILDYLEEKNVEKENNSRETDSKESW